MDLAEVKQEQLYEQLQEWFYFSLKYLWHFEQDVQTLYPDLMLPHQVKELVRF